MNTELKPCNKSLYCRSEFGKQGCYRTNIYAQEYDPDPDNKPKFAINCEGHGCFYLNQSVQS